MKSTAGLRTGQTIIAHCLNSDVTAVITDISDDTTIVARIESSDPPRSFVGELLIVQAFEIEDPDALRYSFARKESSR